jgi:putative transcriptional regulator
VVNVYTFRESKKLFHIKYSYYDIYFIHWLVYKNKKMNRIKEVLEEKGIKQIWLAEKLGKSYNMVNGYVQNRRQPSLEDLYKIAEILDVEVEELLNKK